MFFKPRSQFVQVKNITQFISKLTSYVMYTMVVRFMKEICMYIYWFTSSETLTNNQKNLRWGLRHNR